MFGPAQLQMWLKAKKIRILCKPIKELPYAELLKMLNFPPVNGKPHKIVLAKPGDSVTFYGGISGNFLVDKNAQFHLMVKIIFDSLSIMNESFEDWLQRAESSYGIEIKDKIRARCLYEYFVEENRLFLNFIGMRNFAVLTSHLSEAIVDQALEA